MTTNAALGNSAERSIRGGEIDTKHILSVDLEELIQDHVWKIYTSGLNAVKKVFVRHSKLKEDMHHRIFMRNRNLYIDISWGYVEFEHNSEVKEREKKESDKANESVQLYFCEYENRTKEEHVHAINTSRHIMSSTCIEEQETFKAGANSSANFTKVVSLDMAMSRESSVTKTNREGFSETLTWDNKTDVRVPPNHRVKAALYSIEDPSAFDFITTTTVSLPHGKLPCFVKRRSDDKVVQVYYIRNLKSIVPQYLLDRGKVVIKEVQKDPDSMIDLQLELKTTGVLRNVSSQSHRIIVESENIEQTESDTAQTTEGTTKSRNNQTTKRTTDSDKNQATEGTTESDKDKTTESTFGSGKDNTAEGTAENDNDNTIKGTTGTDTYQVTEGTTESDKDKTTEVLQGKTMLIQ